jgi:hypothetical protein
VCVSFVITSFCKGMLVLVPFREGDSATVLLYDQPRNVSIHISIAWYILELTTN